jgi:hypothetical protein
MQRSTVVFTSLALVVAVAACDDSAMDDPVDPLAAVVPNGYGMAGSATYEITIENLTDGQPLTPALIATHREPDALFHVGETASFGMKEIAENGNLGPMLMRLDNDKHVSEHSVIFGAAGPVMVHETVVGTIATDRGAKYLSWVSMLICTNDGFTGLDGARLPDKVGDLVTFHTNGYDAGTETNTEDFADMVPPCPVLTNVPSTDPGTGMSDPALAEGGVIHHHAGIQGVADLQVAVHGWTDPVARVDIRRVQ